MKRKSTGNIQSVCFLWIERPEVKMPTLEKKKMLIVLQGQSEKRRSAEINKSINENNTNERFYSFTDGNTWLLIKREQRGADRDKKINKTDENVSFGVNRCPSCGLKKHWKENHKKSFFHPSTGWRPVRERYRASLLRTGQNLKWAFGQTP